MIGSAKSIGALLIAGLLVIGAPAYADGSNAGAGNQRIKIIIQKTPTGQRGGTAQPQPVSLPVTVTARCGTSEAQLIIGDNPVPSHTGCFLGTLGCLPTTTADGRQRYPVVVGTRLPDFNWSTRVECVADARPSVTPALVRAEVVKLLPEAPIRTGPPGGRALVNLQVLFWADTPVDRDLGPVTLLGHRVDIRIYAAETRWDFGDGSSDVSDGPGVRYDAADHCTTRICPGYFGHIYDRTGPMTVSATVRWAAEFRVDGGQWQAINDADATPQVIDGPTSTTNLTIVEARGVLVEASPR